MLSKCLRSFLKIKHFSVHADIFSVHADNFGHSGLKKFLGWQYPSCLSLQMKKKRNNVWSKTTWWRQICIFKYLKMYCFLIVSHDHNVIAVLMWAFMVMTGHGQSSPMQIEWESHIFTSNFRKILLIFINFVLEVHTFGFSKFDSPIMSVPVHGTCSWTSIYQCNHWTNVYHY